MQVLEGNPHHVKGLFRRGTAYMETGDFDEARADFKQVCLISSSSYQSFFKGDFIKESKQFYLHTGLSWDI